MCILAGFHDQLTQRVHSSKLSLCALKKWVNYSAVAYIIEDITLIISLINWDESMYDSCDEVTSASCSLVSDSDRQLLEMASVIITQVDERNGQVESTT